MPQDFFVGIYMMKLKLFLLTSLLFLTTSSVTTVYAQTVRESIAIPKAQDVRTLILRDYFTKYNSPLVPYAQDFIEAADTYDLDWRFVPAVTGVESTFGKRIPGSISKSSYNGWGWGVYGTNTLYFKSWREGIFTVSEGLKKEYFDKGYTDPYTINKKYAASPTWGSKVTYFLNDIRKFEYEYLQRNAYKHTIQDETLKVAGRSAEINID